MGVAAAVAAKEALVVVETVVEVWMEMGWDGGGWDGDALRLLGPAVDSPLSSFSCLFPASAPSGGASDFFFKKS